MMHETRCNGVEWVNAAKRRRRECIQKIDGWGIFSFQTLIGTPRLITMADLGLMHSQKGGGRVACFQHMTSLEILLSLVFVVLYAFRAISKITLELGVEPSLPGPSWMETDPCCIDKIVIWQTSGGGTGEYLHSQEPTPLLVLQVKTIWNRSADENWNDSGRKRVEVS